MNFGQMHDLSSEVKLVASLAPVAGTGSAQNGAAVNRTGYLTCIVPFAYSTSGGVTGGTITVKLESSATSGGTYAQHGSTTTITLSGTNPSGVQEVSFDLASANVFIRAVVDADPTGGTPASIVSAPILLGGANKVPAA